MGLSSQSFKLLNLLKTKLKNKKVLSLGNPTIRLDTLRELKFSKKFIINFLKVDRKERARYFFKKVYGCKLEILDYSNYQGAEHIYDLNQKIVDSKLERQFVLILDPGTSEHVFNINLFFKNIFNFLQKGGIYFFQAPLNGWINHGYRQYQPNFFYDLCKTNNKTLSLLHLYIYNRKVKTLINLLPYFLNDDIKNHDIYLESQLKVNAINLNKFKDNYFFLLSQIGGLSDNIGMIEKINISELNFSVIQEIYKDPFAKIIALPKEKSSKERALSKLKNLYIALPISNFLKIKLLETFLKLKKIKLFNNFKNF